MSAPRCRPCTNGDHENCQGTPDQPFPCPCSCNADTDRKDTDR